MAERTYEEPTGWTGWIAFAGVMMILVGILGAIAGLVAIFNDQWVVWTNANALVVDLTGWGWIHLIIGVIVVLAGFGLFTGNVIARMIAVIVAGVSLIANFLWLPAYPIWSLVVITIDLLVLWAVIAHGGEMRSV